MAAPEPKYIELSGGGHLAYQEEGDPAGAPVLFCHGWPASRLQGASFSIEAREMGLRILSPDRPGIGLSTPQPGRRLLDWPPLVAEMMDKLGIEQFSILGVSGGGPYTLATSWALPTRVRAAVVVSGAPPLGPDVDQAALFPIYRWLLHAYRKQPTLLRSAFTCARPLLTAKPPRWAWPFLLRLTSPSDAQALASIVVQEGSYECYREAWRSSAHGVVEDAEVYAHAWGFPLEEVNSPVRIWHGRADRSFHWTLAEKLSQRLPSAEFRLTRTGGTLFAAAPASPSHPGGSAASMQPHNGLKIKDQPSPRSV